MGILAYFTVTFTPEAWKRPVRDFFTGELKRDGAVEPELKIGTERVFRAVPKWGAERAATPLLADLSAKQRNLFREIPKGAKERPKQAVPVPELPEGSGLLAVWMDGDTRVAVMTDGTVREGEPWGQFTVEKISPEAVILRHETGERVVRLGEVRAKPGAAVATAASAAPAKPAEGSPEAQLQKITEAQKSADPSKLLQGFPQKILDSIMGAPKKPAEAP